MFGDIHVKTISEETSFTRATIYNYFKNMDEIFLSAYQQEYVLWAKDLRAIGQRSTPMSHAQLADAIAHSLETHERMLRLSTADFHERETHCRRELVFEHKAAFSEVIAAFHDCIARFCPEKVKKRFTASCISSSRSCTACTGTLIFPRCRAPRGRPHISSWNVPPSMNWLIVPCFRF